MAGRKQASQASPAKAVAATELPLPYGRGKTGFIEVTPAEKRLVPGMDPGARCGEAAFTHSQEDSCKIPEPAPPASRNAG
jgi:hypothetical protein